MHEMPVPYHETHSPERFEEERVHLKQLQTDRSAICNAAGEFLAAAFPHARAQASELASVAIGLVDYLYDDALNDVNIEEACHKANVETARQYNSDPARIQALVAQLEEAQQAVADAEAGIAKMPEDMRPLGRMALPMLSNRVKQIQGEITWMEQLQGEGR